METSVKTTFEVDMPVTVTVTLPEDTPKLELPAYAAVMTLLPDERLLPLTVRVAPEAVSGADPSTVLPSVKVTVPAGAIVPAEAFTTAVTWVVPAAVILAGAAVTVVAVGTEEEVTVTVVVPVELAKALPP